MKHIGLFLLFLIACQPAWANVHFENLYIATGQLNVLAVNDNSFEEDRTTSKGFLSHQSTTTRHATSTNIGSQLSGGNVSLTSNEVSRPTVRKERGG